MPNTIIRRRVLLLPEPINAITKSYISRAGISDKLEISAIDNFVTSMLANSNIYNSLVGGFVYLVSPTSYGASLYNLLSTNFYPSAGAAPTYSQNGWFFDGATQYLKTGFNPLSSTTINSAFTAMYIRNNIQSGFFYGANNATASAAWIMTPRNTLDQARFLAYNTATTFNPSSTNSSGTFVFCINASNSRYVRRDSVSLGTSSAAVGGTRPNFECYVGARNLNGSPNSFGNFECSTLCQGTKALSTSDADILSAMIQTYNSTVISGGR